MKRQLDRLKGKRLVTGDPNLMTKDEICINATPNGVEVKEIGTDGSIKDIASGGGGGDTVIQYEYEYLKVNAFEIGFNALSEIIKDMLNFYYFTIYKGFRDYKIDNEFVYVETTQLNAISDSAVYIKTIKNIYPNVLSWSDRLEGEVYNIEIYKELLGMPNLDVNFNNFLKFNVVENPDLGEEVYNKFFSIPTKEEMDEVIANTRYNYSLY